MAEETIRLNKYLASCGIASRRACVVLIEQGLVKVDGEIILEGGFRLKPGSVVTYKGQAVKPETKRVYVLLNKAKNYVTTVQDERGRKTVMDIIGEKIPERIYPVGRLDRTTTGLLLITNDGDLAKKLSHPSHRVKKVYNATLDKGLTRKHLDQIREGLVLEDGTAEVDWVNYTLEQNHTEVTIEIHIGKNRIVRRIFEHLGYNVERLDRVYYAGLTKKDLPRGRWRHLTHQEIIMLRHFG
jgi:23S rRNA pseudouridine2605 synthase